MSFTVTQVQPIQSSIMAMGLVIGSEDTSVTLTYSLTNLYGVLRSGTTISGVALFSVTESTSGNSGSYAYNFSYEDTEGNIFTTIEGLLQSELS